MSVTERATPRSAGQAGNCLIDRLPGRQRADVIAQCDTVDLASGCVLCETGEPFDYAYFPITGSISLRTTIDGRDAFETENIGREGMLGVALLLRVNRAPQRGVVQTPCVALRMQDHHLRRALQEHPALLRILQAYLCFVLAELSQAIGCVRYHEVSGRLARALLLAHDRVVADDLQLLTHRLLADMLGVQRGSVTIAAARLQRAGVIQYSRGKIAVLDRERLEAAACGCYRAGIENYARQLPHPPADRIP